MRLIDADRLLNPGYTDMFDEPIKLDMFSRYAIESEPTVNAIPIEWINKWVKEKCYDEQGRYKGEGNDHWYDMMEDWGKENE